MSVGDTGENIEDDNDHGEVINVVVFHPTGNYAEDMSLAQNQCLAVDNNNESALENISAVGAIPLVSNLFPSVMGMGCD